MIYLDNAATTSPKPQSVRRAVDEAMRSFVANPGRGGHDQSMRVADLVYNTRLAVADLFGFDRPEQVVFTLNCTHAINYVLKGCLHQGDHVVVSSLEHNAVMRPLHKLMQEGRITYDVAQVDFEDDAATVANFRNLLRDNTRMVVCTHASNVTGQILPIREIGELCRQHGILFTVDAAQSAGVLALDLSKLPIDYLCCAGHKGLYGPMGMGILVVAGPAPDSILEGGTGNLSAQLGQPDALPERLESGTVNVSGIAGVRAGVGFVRTRGEENLYRSELRLIQKAYRGLSSLRDVHLYTPFPQMGRQVPVLSFNVGGTPSMEVGEYLNQKGIAVRPGLHCAPSAHRELGTLEYGTVRISPAAFNTPQEIDRLIYAISDFLRKKRR